jgi:parallel beta-helix repeat protein
LIQRTKYLIVLFLVVAISLPLSATAVKAAPAQPAPLPQSGGGNRVFLPGVSNGAEGFYVATYGSDSNPGSFNQPWRTLAKAARAVAGMTVYVRGGTYSEVLDISNSGTSGQPIRILAYRGETPVIDGGGSLPGSEKGLITIRGSYTEVSGFEVRNSRYYGVMVMGHHSIISNSYVHHSQMFGIFARGDYSVVENNRVWRSSLNNENAASPSRYYAALTAGGSSGSNIIVQNITLRNNTVWENWGEGISTFNANGTVIEGNTVHDSYEANIYLSDSTNVVCQRNFLYMNPSSYVYNHGANVGISMGDETFKPRSANIKVLNNIAYGNSGNFFWWRMDSASGLVNVEIANNTFVNSNHEGGVIIQAGAHQNSRFANNLVVQDGSLPVISVSATSGITYTNNLWSKAPYSIASGSSSLIGDPRLAKSGSQYGADWYRLTGSSPAIGRGAALPDASVDYFNSQRDNPPDIGASEFVP